MAKSLKTAAKKPAKPKRKYARIDNYEIFRIIKAGGLDADLEDGTIYRIRGDERKEIPQVPDRRGRYLFVYVYHRGKRRKIAVHVLIWMIGAKSMVPKGCDVHHCDEDRENNSFRNLEPEDLHDHRSRHGRVGAAVANGYPPGWDEVDLTDDEFENAKHSDEADVEFVLD